MTQAGWLKTGVGSLRKQSARPLLLPVPLPSGAGSWPRRRSSGPELTEAVARVLSLAEQEDLGELG